MSAHLIRRLRVPHCARGPARCVRCQETTPRWALLDVDPPDADRIARPMIEVDGTLRVYDVVRFFDDRAQAVGHAEAHGVPMQEEEG